MAIPKLLTVAEYQAQISVQNGITTFIGSSYPSSDFFLSHWKYGGGSTIIIPSSLAWNELKNLAPDLSRLDGVKNFINSGQVGDSYVVSGAPMKNNTYIASGFLFTSPIPYSLGSTAHNADMNFVKSGSAIAIGSVTYSLMSDRFDYVANPKELGTYMDYLKWAGGKAAGAGLA